MLSRVYGIEHTLDVHDFLVTDGQLLEQLETDQSIRPNTEKLLICQSEDEVGMTLYLDAELLERLASMDPRQHLGHWNLADFWAVLEGLSHFNYVAWNAAADKTVTLMELELQAEVDKYIGARILSEQQQTSLGAGVYRRLFEDPRFDEDLNPAELSRYRNASLYAARFCRSLEARFGGSDFLPAVLSELRTFYRLPQPEKVGHIQAASFA